LIIIPFRLGADHDKLFAARFRAARGSSAQCSMDLGLKAGFLPRAIPAQPLAARGSFSFREKGKKVKMIKSNFTF
jgi:hypothetical protein